MRTIVTLLIIFFICLLNLLAQPLTKCYFNETADEPFELTVNLKHLDAWISFEPEQNKVIAITDFTVITKRFQTDSIVFYAPAFKFSSISITGIDINYRTTDKDVIIYPKNKMAYNQEYHIIFSYFATPEEGTIYFVGWNDPLKIKRKQIWAHRPHNWLPFIDDRLSVDMYVNFDSKYKVFSNGVRMEVADSTNGTKTWHYRMNKNHPFFSTALVIGEYEYKTLLTKRGIEEELWIYPDQLDRYNETYRYSTEMIDFFENELDFKYPYELYRQAPVHDYLFGAMETTTSTVFGDYMVINRSAYWQRNYINVNAHELAHQWFGNCISHLTPKDVWLTESFATYYAKIFEKNAFGLDYYQNDRRTEMDKAFSEAKNNNYPLASSRAGTNRIYQKGSLVLDMLRDVIGNDYFKIAVNYYLNKYQHNYAETHDFLRSISNSTGMNLDWFFEEWVQKGGEPHYSVSYKSIDEENSERKTMITVEQIQPIDELVGLFRMPIDIIVYYRDGSYDSTRAWIKDKINVVMIQNKMRKNIDFVVFDPADKILKKITFPRDYAELAAQATKSPNMIDRYNALLALRDFPIDKKRNLLNIQYKNEKFHLTKSEIIYQISKDDNAMSLRTIKSAIYDNDALVRRSVVDYVTDVNIEIRRDYEKLLKDSSYANIELALQNLRTSYPKDTDLYLDIVGSEEGWRGKNVRIKYLETAISSGKKEFIPELVKYSSESYEFETRINSINTLKKLNIFDEEIALNIIKAYGYWNFKVSNAAKEAILYFNQQDSFKNIIKTVINNGHLNSNLNKKIKDLVNK